MLSRRELIKIVAATTLPAWLVGVAMAGKAPPAIRYSANGTSAAAKAALSRYRAAVAVLKSRPDYDPKSWVWQANIHGWPGQFLPFNAPNPQAELERVFESGPILTELTEAERQIRRHMAESTWGTCPHGSSDFLPWHRVYLFLFERILQDAIGDKEVTVPYWDWHQARALPAGFRTPTVEGNANSLFWDRRNSGVNGEASGASPAELIDAEVSHASLSEACFDQSLEPRCAFTPEGGFSPALEVGPHGNVHVFVGGVDGMGFFEMAGRDPIFYAHHGNIDRLWSSWSASPSHEEPATATAWLQTAHTFIGVDGTLKTLTTAQALKASMILGRGYVYDRLEVVPAVRVAENQTAGGPTPRTSGEQRELEATLIAKADGLELGAASATTPLVIVDPAPLTAAESGSRTRRYTLVLSGLTYDAGPRDNFMVFLNLPDGAPASTQSESFVKIVNFFVVPHTRTNHVNGSHGAETRIDVTEAVERLARAGQLQNLRVTLAPVRGNVPKDARPRVGTIRLLSE